MARKASSKPASVSTNLGFEAKLWLAPYKGRIYDPCRGSGGMFVQSEKFIEAHGGKRGDSSIYGQDKGRGGSAHLISQREPAG